MQVLVVMLSRTDVLHEILGDFVESGIKGATVFHTYGLSELVPESLPFFGRVSYLTSGKHQDHRTIMTVLEDDQVETAVQVVEKHVGDLEQPDTAFAFTMPVLFVKGLSGHEWHANGDDT
ncbi:MAG: hypothetical protein PHV61_09675 [Limnochordia bacterium]|jgi:nitrogen regulatory protein P-II 1|nr:hypothetical protein [Limnochordia bacterium]MDD2630410.1 hypothetical protein [Limnochordia bacterium]MDD4518088.1 hypothetical protein [Limnochordia bacterium]